jgi:CRISPR/Cas system-associated exonuclease Cas4 (RecB family)
MKAGLVNSVSKHRFSGLNDRGGSTGIQMLKYFSHSSLETYRKCPQQFKLRYVDQISKPDESIEAFMGKRVHETLEYLYQQVLDGRLVFFDTIVDFYHRRWRETWHDRVAVVRSHMTPEDYRDLGEDCLAWYYRNYSPFSEPVVGNEIVLEFALDSDGDYPFKGIIDRLDHKGDGHWEIHDYKTGKQSYSQSQADRDKQLALYQIALQKLYPDVQEVELVWHFVQSGIEVRSKRTASQLARIVEDTCFLIDKIRRVIQAGGPFPPRESALCNWCYYWEECPAKSTGNPYL